MNRPDFDAADPSSGGPKVSTLAPASYWDEQWKASFALLRRTPGGSPLGFLDPILRRHLPPPGASFVEVGCGGSAFLPYFARAFGYEVSGLDFSGPGCELARLQLEAAGVAGKVLEMDMFAPDPRYLEQYDVAGSFGVVEHFEETALAVAAVAALVRPGGWIVTTVPNMVSLYGWLQGLVSPEILARHVRLDREQLARAHSVLGIQQLHCDYLGVFNLGVVNLGMLPTAFRFLERVAAVPGFLLRRVLEPTGFRPESRTFSPYILFVGRKARAGARATP